MTIKLSFFLYLYFAFIVVWAIFSVIALYHMFKFGFKKLSTYAVIVLYILVALFMLSISVYYINQFDWTLVIFDSSNINNSPYSF
ncbi:hypothetical protein C0583_06355 [Candidatus Parcubacteria bacterium]|nr:MAG: hypothetical protein C0583_06355 [Candidatus Parcubacteria bacterium]